MSRRIYDKIALKFNVSQLDKVIISLINNPQVKKFAGNTNNLFIMLSEDSFKDDYDKEVRVFLIRRITSTILQYNINDKATLLTFLDIDGRYADDATEVLNSLYDQSLNDHETQLIDNLISNQLRYSTLDSKADNLIDLITDLKGENFEDFNEHIDKITQSIDVVSRGLRDAKESLFEGKTDINLSDDSFVGVLKNVITENRKPSNKIKTGLQALNKMTNGGFEKGRVYCYFAVAKGWKSGLLLNSAIWAKKYNKFETRDKTKRPVILYLTLENTIKETIERIWSHSFTNDSAIEQYEPEMAAEMLAESGIFTPGDKNSAEIVMKYRTDKSISTQDLHGICDDIEKEGGEVVFIVLDYIKRVRAAIPQKEVRFELGQIANELSAIAKDRDIPVVTAHQLNREAFREIEMAETFEKKMAATSRLGSANIGESIDIIQNIDYGIIISRIMNPRYDEAGNLQLNDRFLTFKLIASRAKQSPITSFKHRFPDNNDMALIEDFNLQHSVSIINDEALIREVARSGEKSFGGRKIIVNKKD